MALNIAFDAIKAIEDTPKVEWNTFNLKNFLKKRK